MWARSRSAIKGALAFATAFLPAPALACDVAVVRTTGEVVLRYDPFDAQNAPVELALTVRNRDAKACQFDMAVLKDRLAQRRLLFAPSGLEVEVRTAGTGAALLTEGAEPGVWRGTAPGGGEQEYRLSVLVVKDAVPPAGRLDLPLELELRSPGGATALSPATPVSLVIESPPRAQLNIAGATGYFGSAPSVSTVDLGTLAAGVRKRLFLQVRSNVAAPRLSVRSEHRGQLKPIGAATHGETAGVPYHAELAEEPIDLRKDFERQLAVTPSLTGQSLPFEIVVDEFEARVADTYSDVLTIELSPL